MLAWNVTEDDLRAAAADVGLALHGDWNGHGVTPQGRALRFRLNVNEHAERDADGFLPYQRQSTSLGRNRRIAAVCWHGHRDYMRALFARCPDARIKTALADYRGAEDFEAKYRDTFGIGNHYNLAYGQACNCAREPITAETTLGWF